MGGFVPSKPKTSAADEQLKITKDENEKLKEKNKATVKNLKGRRGGRSLLAFSETGEQGVTKSSTLGG